MGNSEIFEVELVLPHGDRRLALQHQDAQQRGEQEGLESERHGDEEVNREQEDEGQDGSSGPMTNGRSLRTSVTVR